MFIQIIANLLWLIIGAAIFLLGAFIFSLAVEKNPKLATKLFYNTFGGIIGGIVVYIFIVTRENNGNWLDYFLAISFSILFMGLMFFILIRKIRKKRK